MSDQEPTELPYLHELYALEKGGLGTYAEDLQPAERAEYGRRLWWLTQVSAAPMSIILILSPHGFSKIFPILLTALSFEI